jgi:hypothetical protein
MSRISSLVFVPLLFWAQWASADVFKCVGADGKTSYSAAPCATEGAKEVRVPIVAAPTPDVAAPHNDWAAANAAANARGMAANTQRPSLGGMFPFKLGQGAKSAKSDKQIVAECESTHGINCNSAQEIGQRRDQLHVRTQEEMDRQAVIGARRRREQQLEDTR